MRFINIFIYFLFELKKIIAYLLIFLLVVGAIFYFYSESESLRQELTVSYRVRMDGNFVITYPYGLDDYAEAILQICSKASQGFKAIYRLSVQTSARISIYVSSNCSQLLLYTNYYQIYLNLTTDEDLLPPTMGGHHQIFGFCHEIGHMIFLVDNYDFNEGWATYSAAFRIVPYVYQSLGQNVWPQPYNYSEADGSDRYLKFVFENQTLCTPGSMYAATKLLYTIDQKCGQYGPLLLGDAIRTLEKNGSLKHGLGYPWYNLGEFKDTLTRQLASYFNDTTIESLFSEYGF